jgi:TetR/AcrR family transcriptional regulator
VKEPARGDRGGGPPKRASSGDAVGRLLGLADGHLRFAREHPGHFRVFRFLPPDAPADGPIAGAAERVAERVRSEVERMAGAIAEAIDVGVLGPPSIPGARRSFCERHGTA